MKYENIIPGIVSVTFRKFDSDRIISLAKENGLEAIEWGSDVHLKPGDADTAKHIKANCAANGILPVSYGSYQGKGEDGEDMFRETVETATILGTKNIRIWAGQKNSEDVTEEERKDYVSYAQRLADIAAEKDIDVSFECHRGTLTNTPDSAVRLMEEIGRKNVCLYWQPLQPDDVKQNVRIINTFLPYLKNVHVYAWDKNYARFPLSDHEKAWNEYAEAISKDGKKRAMLLEFVKDDSPEQLADDAKTLLRIMGR